MNNLTKIISTETKDSSDDFFQSKHINKRKEEFKKQEEIERYLMLKKQKEALPKLLQGIDRIKIAHHVESWKDEREKLFLELFSKLHVDDKFFQNDYRYGYFLLDEYSNKRCFYNLKTDYFRIYYDSIWKIFETQFNMNFHDIQSLMNELLIRHFKLYDVTACFSFFLQASRLIRHFKLYDVTTFLHKR